MNIYDDLTLIIVTYRSEALIVKNLAVLKKFKVIIIDNSNSEKLQLIIKDYNNINLIRSSKNLGYGKAVNLGILQSNTYFVLTISPDILLNESSIEILFTTFINNIDNIGLLGPSLYDANMKRRTNGTISYIKKLTGDKIFNSINNIPEGNICCEYLVGCCYLIKRDFFNFIGGFDEDFFMYFEDNDLCDRILQNNKLIMEVPSSKFIHLENSSSVKKKFTDIKLSIIHKISSYIYLKKKTNFIFLTLKIFTNFIDYLQRFIINLLFFNFKKSLKNLLRIISIILYLTLSYKFVYRFWKM